jgi:hypothetical protein
MQYLTTIVQYVCVAAACLLATATPAFADHVVDCSKDPSSMRLPVSKRKIR